MISALHIRPQNDPLKRIVGTNATHRVIYNPLTQTYRVVSIYSTVFNRREQPCFTVHTGSEWSCENFKNNHND